LGVLLRDMEHLPSATRRRVYMESHFPEKRYATFRSTMYLIPREIIPIHSFRD
jgi:hypothetical protein